MRRRRGSSGSACCARTSWTCARCCGAGRATRSCAPPCARGSGASPGATASRTASCPPGAACPRSAADSSFPRVPAAQCAEGLGRAPAVSKRVRVAVSEKFGYICRNSLRKISWPSGRFSALGTGGEGGIRTPEGVCQLIYRRRTAFFPLPWASTFPGTARKSPPHSPVAFHRFPGAGLQIGYTTRASPWPARAILGHTCTGMGTP